MATKRVFDHNDNRKYEGSLVEYINSWELTPGFRGDLPNLTKAEFADLMFQYVDEAEKMKTHTTLVFELPDGRRLLFSYRHFDTTDILPELNEWEVVLMTLDQRTPRCLRRWKERKAWLYIAPYQGEGYKRRGKFDYKVWW